MDKNFLVYIVCEQQFTVYKNILRQTIKNSGIWENVTFTFDPVKSCDLLVVINRCHKAIRVNCPPKNVWLIAWEPPTVFHKWFINGYKYFDKVFSQWKISQNKYIESHGALPWMIDKTYDELIALDSEEVQKEKFCSYITSNRTQLKGHQFRVDLRDYLLKKNVKVDLFGRGFNFVDDKYDALYPYKYSIIIENYITENYWTEKISDAFLSWTMPIYIGPPNIFDYFPRESMIYLPKYDLNAVHREVEKLRGSNMWEERLKYIEEARNLVLNENQLFPFIYNKIISFNLLSKTNKKEEVFLPRIIGPWDADYKLSFTRKVEYKIRKFLDLKPY